MLRKISTEYIVSNLLSDTLLNFNGVDGEIIYNPTTNRFYVYNAGGNVLNPVASAVTGLSQPELTSLATAIMPAVPTATLAAALVALIASLPTAAVGGAPALWNNAGTLKYS